MNFFKKIPKKLFFVTTIYIFIFCVLSIIKYKLFLYNSYDLAIYNQALWNTLHGAPYWITVTFPHIFLSDHIESGLFFLLPIYALFQHPITLLIIQSFFLGSAGIPLYFIAKHFWKNERFALGATILWLLNPFVQNINLFEFHFASFFPFFIFSAIYAYLKQNKWLYAIMFFFAVSTREDTGLVAFGFVLILILDWIKNKADRKNISFFIFYSLASISIWSFFTYSLIGLFSELGGTKYISHYSWLRHTTSPYRVLLHIFSLQNINVFIGMLMPLAFLPLFKPRWLLLSSVSLTAVFLLNNTIDHTSILHLHYMATILPGIFLATMENFIFIAKQPNQFYQKIIVIILFISTLYAGIFFGPLWPRNLSAFMEIVQARQQTWQEANKVNKNNKPYLADEHFLPQLYLSKNVYATAQLYRGEKEFTDLRYPLPCNIENVIISYDKIAQSALFSSFYNSPYASFQNIQTALDCHLPKNFYYDEKISISYDIKEKTILNNAKKAVFTDLKINQNKEKIIISGIIQSHENIDWNKTILRAEIFNNKQKTGLTVIQKINQPGDFNMKITSKRFLQMANNHPEINLYLVENGGFATIGWLNSFIEVIAKPHIIYAAKTVQVKTD